MSSISSSPVSVPEAKRPRRIVALSDADNGTALPRHESTISSGDSQASSTILDSSSYVVILRPVVRRISVRSSSRRAFVSVLTRISRIWGSRCYQYKMVP